MELGLEDVEWFSPGGVAAAPMSDVLLLGEMREEGSEMPCGGVQDPGSAAVGTEDGHRGGAFLPAQNGRRPNLEVQVGVTRWAPGAFASWLMRVAGNVTA